VDLDELPELLDGLRYLDEKYTQLTSVGITDYTELNTVQKGSSASDSTCSLIPSTALSLRASSAHAMEAKPYFLIEKQFC
jgi:hypothetical protein